MANKKLHYGLLIIFVVVLCVYYSNRWEPINSETAFESSQVSLFEKKFNEINFILKEIKSDTSKIRDSLLPKINEVPKASNEKVQETKLSDKNVGSDDVKSHLRIYDFSQDTSNQKFECVKTKQIIVQTTVCILDTGNDPFISASIKTAGVWEPDIVELFMRMLNSDKNINVFDIGAQIGQYSLFAGKLGRKVISIEPFYNSYIRLQQSIKLENMQNQFILLTNALSDKRGEVRRLNNVVFNVGAQSLVNDKNDYKNSGIDLKSDPFLVETIIMDDIVEIIPNDFNQAIMKIDIEGYELKAFQNAVKLFSKVNILAVFMEWKYVKYDNNITQLLDFFYSRNYEAQGAYNSKILLRNEWMSWDDDVIFIKKDFKY